MYCTIDKTTSRIWNNKGQLVIWASALSPSNNLHWFQTFQITPVIGHYSLAMDDQSYLWHLWLGHPSQNALHQLTKSVKGIPPFDVSSDISSCKGCAMGKMIEKSYPDSSKRATCPLALVHTDLVGPFPVESQVHSCYILTLVDDFSGYAIVAFLRNKDNAAVCFLNMVKWCETFSGSTLISVRSDHGRKFIGRFQSFLPFRGVTYQTSAPHVPQQNGHAKRFNHTMLEKAKAIMHHACMPRIFWQDAAEVAVHIYNTYETSLLENTHWNIQWRPPRYILFKGIWDSCLCLYTTRVLYPWHSKYYSGPLGTSLLVIKRSPVLSRPISITWPPDFISVSPSPLIMICLVLH